MEGATNYPLLFGLRELIEGNGFIARVAVSGRALLSEDDGEVWIDTNTAALRDWQEAVHWEARSNRT